MDNGFQHEIDFWRGFIKTDRFLKGWCGNHKTPELNQEVADFILSVPHDSVLDVGSGVVSILNGLVPCVVPADPLGEQYEKIFDYGWFNLPKPMPMGAEDIEFDKFFDIVHISNAIDHAKNPVQGIKQLYQAVKEGGYLIIQGFENEGEYENYQGLHQWNIHLAGDVLVINDAVSSVTTINLDGVVLAKTIKLNTGKNWFIWICRRS